MSCASLERRCSFLGRKTGEAIGRVVDDDAVTETHFGAEIGTCVCKLLIKLRTVLSSYDVIRLLRLFLVNFFKFSVNCLFFS